MGIKPLTDKQFILLAKKPHYLGHYLGFDLLGDIHSKWINDLWKATGTKVLQAHRKSYKTTAVLIVGTVWWLTFWNPEETILFLRKSWEQAAEIVAAVKNIFNTEKMRSLFMALYGIDETIGRPDRDTAFNLSIKKNVTPETNVSCLGIGGNITGAHPSKIFADDIITIKDRTSKAEREKTKTFLKELINVETVDGVTCYTGTPWHAEDGFSILPKPDKYPVGSIEINGFTQKKLNEYKEFLGPSLYSANYKLEHISRENALFVDPNYDAWPKKFKKLCGWVDPSYQGKNTTALALLGIGVDNKTYCRGWAWPEHIVELYHKITKICKEFKVGSLYVETNGDKGFSKKDLAGLYPSVIGRNETSNKHIKIISFLKQNWKNLIFAKDCQGEFLNQILDYEEGLEPDDAPDALAALIREMGVGKKSILERF